MRKEEFWSPPFNQHDVVFVVVVMVLGLKKHDLDPGLPRLMMTMEPLPDRKERRSNFDEFD